MSVELHVMLNKFQQGDSLSDKEVECLGQAISNASKALALFREPKYLLIERDLWVSLDRLRQIANARNEIRRHDKFTGEWLTN